MNPFLYWNFIMDHLTVFTDKSLRFKAFCCQNQMGKLCRCIVKSPLPDDIIFYQILPRVPAEVLHSWRFVSKRWFHMLSNEPEFLDAQLAMSRPRFIFDVQCTEYWSHSRYRKKFDVEITFNNITRTITSFAREDFVLNKSDWISNTDDFKEAVDCTSWRSLNSSCNGLILVYNYHQVKGPMYYVVNPATRQWATLPQCIRATHNGGGLGYDPVTMKYKVVQIFRLCSKLSRIESYGCAVLTLGSDRWKLIRYPFKIADELERSLYVNGFLHFKCGDGPELPGYNTFVSMDIANETFRMTKPPEGICSKVTIFKLGDSLALSPRDANLCIWVLEDCSKGIWSKKYSFTTNLRYGCRRRGLRGGLPDILQPIGAFNSGQGEVVIYKEETGFRLFYYVTWSDELKELTSPWKNIHCERRSKTVIWAFNHVGTLVSPHHLVHKTA